MIVEGNMQSEIASSGRYAVVVAKFNETITNRLLEGAVSTLRDHGVAEGRVEVIRVPGAFELPTVAETLARQARFSAVICLGAVIRGETSHDQHINRSLSHQLADIGVRHRLPVIFGVLTCNTVEQAEARSGAVAPTRGKDTADSKIGNKGIEAAQAALEMVDLMVKIRRS